MKKIAIFVLILALGMAMTATPSFAKNQKTRGIWMGLGIGAAAATIFNGIEHGRWSPVITRDRGYYPPPPPPSLPSSYPSYPSPQPREYSHSYSPAFPWQGVRVALSDRGGWGDEASVRGIVIDALRSWGAEVIITRGSYGQSYGQVDAPYALEIQTRSEGNRAVVELWLIERATGAVRLHGLGPAEFYYDGSDRWRSFQWAASRALANLR